MRNGMTGATGNIYCGLHEFVDMGFLLHLLRPGDLFVDVGANVGSYTVLASAVCGAEAIAIEPDPGAAAILRRNVEENKIGDCVEVLEIASGQAAGVAQLTIGNDTTNRITGDISVSTRKVIVKSLDELLVDRVPTLIKVDVEGYEPAVIAGAKRTLTNPSLKAVIIETVTPEIDASLLDAGFCRGNYDPFMRSLHFSNPDKFKYHSANTLYVRGREVRDVLLSAPKRNVAGLMV